MRLTIALVIAACATVAAADWPQWRGPHGSGVSDEKDVPVRWSATENVTWKTSITGLWRLVADCDRRSHLRHLPDRCWRRRPGNHPRLVQGADPAAAGERALATGDSTRRAT